MAGKKIAATGNNAFFVFISGWLPRRLISLVKKGTAMILRELEKYLHDHIPLGRAMGVEVIEADHDSVKLSAPLAPNINHRETVFGGSASAVAILAAWTLLHVRLKQVGLGSRIVIQRNIMSYERPIAGKFVASAVITDPAAWKKFLAILRRKSRARISVSVTLHCNEEKVGEFEGDFVALGTQSA